MMRLRLHLAFSFLLTAAALAAEEPRTALVIGCDSSGSDLHLPSPVRDAQALSAVLKGQLGFEVALLTNPVRKELLSAIDRFGETLGKRGGVGLFYFSGHGAQNVSHSRERQFRLPRRPAHRGDRPH